MYEHASLAVRAADLALSYGDSRVVDGVSFALDRGSVLGIVGESGSGKTTLAAAIAGFLPHVGGRIVAGELAVAGIDRRVSTPAHRELIPRSSPGVTMIFQDAMTSMDPVSTIGAQLLTVLRRVGRATARPPAGAGGRAARWEQACELLEGVGFVSPEQQMRMRPGELSGGMRQRALIALAIASRPEVLVADEPTSALDVRLANLTMRLLVESARRHGVALIVVAHDLQLIAAQADEIAVMRAGRIVERGRAHRLVREPQAEYTQQMLACVPRLDSYRRTRLTTVATGERAS